MCACYTENNYSCLCQDNRVPNSGGSSRQGNSLMNSIGESSYQGNSYTSSVIGNPYQGSGYTSSGGNPYQDIGGGSSYQDFGFPKSNLSLKNYNDTKFSQVVVPSFLTSRVKPKPKAKPKGCPNKKKCCPCKDVGCNTCEPCNFEYPPLCNCCGQLASMPECSPMWSSADVFMNQLNGAQGNRPNPIEPNQSQQRLRPAGLPSKTHAPFDPCTGQELWRQVQPTQQITGPQSMPSPFSMQSINSTFGPNMQFGSGTGCCPPCSPWQEMQSTPKQTSSGISLGKSKGKNKKKNSSTNALGKAKNKLKKTKSYTQGKGVDKVLGQKSKRSASADPKQNDFCCCCPNSKMANTAKKPTSEYPTKKPPFSKNKPNNNKSKRQGNNEVQVVNCCNASPDLMTRICNSLQVPRPPESCYLLLPITMSTKGKDEARQNAKGYNQGDINNDEEYDPAAYGRGRPERRSQNECVPRNIRNCACNTDISGNSQDRGNGGGNDNIGDDNNANGSGCGSGCCCWPRRACYYNPYTGRYCWYNNCYCSNGCSNGCNNSAGCCSLPAKEQQSKPNSKQDGSKSSKSQAPPKESSKKDDRFMAGDTGPFQPEGDTWMGYNQYMNNGLNPFLSIPPTGPPSPDHTNPLYSTGSIRSPFSQPQPQQEQQQPPHEQQRALKKEGSRIPSMMI